jgi:hypothetical protein
MTTTSDLNIMQSFSGEAKRIKFAFRPTAKLTSNALAKTMQSFVIRLFTAHGSNLFSPDEGTLLASNLFTRRKQYVSSSEFVADASLSIAQVIETQEKSSVASENVASASISDFAQYKDTVSFKINIVTEAGTSVYADVSLVN